MFKQSTSYSYEMLVSEGNLEKVRELISSFDLSYSQEWLKGCTLLNIATKNKHTAVAKLLLEGGIKVNNENIERADTPLHFAALNGDIEIVKMLLDRGANVNVRNYSGRTPLHNAINCKNIEIIKLLFNQGADVNFSAYYTPEDGRSELPFYYAEKAYYTPLHFAAEGGNAEIIKYLLCKGANINAVGKDGRTPLHIAAERSYVQIVELLLNHGASVSNAYRSIFREGYTPIHLAAEQGSEEIVKLLLSSYAHVDVKADNNLTPLHIAIERGNENVVKLLLEHGANVDAQDKDGKTVLYLAAEIGNLEIVNHILKYRPNVNNQSNKNSLYAAVHGWLQEHSEILESLLQYGFNFNVDDVNNSELLHAAVEYGYVGIVNDLLRYGADVNTLSHIKCKKGYTLLHNAAENEQEEISALLIYNGADLHAKDYTGNTPIFYSMQNCDIKITKLLFTNVKENPELLSIAVYKEFIEMVEFLLQPNTDINFSDECGRTALHFTVFSDFNNFFTLKDPDINVKGKIAKLLLINGANVNAQTNDGTTTLHAAIEKGYAEVVEVLLEHKANINCIDKNNRTLLQLYVEKGNEPICKMLLNKGADVNAQQYDGTTALLIAVQKGNKEIVEVLLKYGAEINSIVEGNTTPLHMAAQKNYEEIVEILLKLGADIDCRDEYGKTPLHIACEAGCIQVVEVLLKNGSNINIKNKYNDTPFESLNYCMSNDNCDESYISICKKIVEVLEKQIIKMKSINLYVNRKNFLAVSNYYKISEFQHECEEEKKKMKSEKISNSGVTFYDILTKNVDQLVKYARNEDIVQELQPYCYKFRFLLYSSMINRQFTKALERKELLDQGYKCFHSLFKEFPEFPHNCTEKILNYLSDKELKILIYACKPIINLNHPNTNDIMMCE